MNKEMMKGSIDLLLLSIIRNKEMYGYEIVQAIKQSTDNTYSMSEGTLYPALKRLENQEFIQSYWVEQDNNRPRKYYRITDEGNKALQSKYEDWTQMNLLISKWVNGGASYE